MIGWWSAIAAIRLFRRKRPDAREMLPLTACECGAIHNNAHELPLSIGGSMKFGNSIMRLPSWPREVETFFTR